MTFSEAQKEFRIRHYRWSISEFEKEIELGFPNLRLLKGGYGRDVYQFMQTLDEKERPMLARALLKQGHSDTSKALGETFTVEDHSLAGRCRIFSMNQDIKFGVEMDARKRAGEKIKFATKRKLCEITTAKFKDAFGNQCVGMEFRDEGDWVSLFYIKCCGWIIRTQFWFGRNESLIDFHHDIVSETKTPLPRQPDILVPSMQLEQRMSWLCFHEFKHLSNEDVNPATDTAIKFCGYFFDAAPKLLKGLEPEKIEGRTAAAP